MTIDAIAALRAADPAPSVAPYAPHRAVQLLDRITSSTPSPSTSRRGRLIAGAVGATTVLLAGGGAAWAVLSQPAGTALKLNCAATVLREEFDQYGGFTAVLDTTSGDPVADCAAEYQRLVGDVPELVAYETGSVYVAVMPADWPAPKGWRPLASTFRSDATRLELKQRLDDRVDGPSAGCWTADETEARVQADLRDLRLVGWRVERLTEAPRTDGRTWCALAWVDEGAERRILIQGLPQDAPDVDTAGGPSLDALIRYLRDDVAAGCTGLQDAEAASRDALLRSGHSPGDARITVLADAAATCTRVDLVPAGVISIVLRGPAA